MVRIDARGMRCPWPAVRLAKALRGGAKAVTVIADDPKAPAELEIAAAAANATIEMILDEVSPTFVVTLRSHDNIVFTQDGYNSV